MIGQQQASYRLSFECTDTIMTGLTLIMVQSQHTLMTGLRLTMVGLCRLWLLQEQWLESIHGFLDRDAYGWVVRLLA